MTSRAHPIDLQGYRYGHPGPRQGLLVGVARHLPRGIRREAYASRGYFDVWLPLLAPSAPLVGAYRKNRITFRQFAGKYRAEMRQAAPRQGIRLLAAMARCHPVRLGCFCADEKQCHRSVLLELITAAAVDLPPAAGKQGEYYSPACAMPEIED